MLHTIEIIFMVLLRPIALFMFGWLKNSRHKCASAINKRVCLSCSHPYQKVQPSDMRLVPFEQRIESYSKSNFHWQSIKLWRVECPNCSTVRDFDIMGDLYIDQG